MLAALLLLAGGYPASSLRLATTPYRSPLGRVRLPLLGLLVSDGLYVGEGQMDALSRDAMAGPLLQPGGELLQQLTELAVA